MSAFDVRIGDTLYPLVRDPAHVHPTILHRRLGTDTTSRDPEFAIRRLLDAVEASNWFDSDGRYRGRNVFGIGLSGRE